MVAERTGLRQENLYLRFPVEGEEIYDWWKMALNACWNLFGWNESKVMGEAVKARAIMGPNSTSHEACMAVWVEVASSFFAGKTKEVIEKDTLFDYKDNQSQSK